MRKRLVVVGGDAGGLTAATQARRLHSADDLEIVALEKSKWVSYSACGIPYVVGGIVDSLDDLIVRTPDQLRTDTQIDVRTNHEVAVIDLDARKVEVRDHEGARTYALDFDVLHVATGAVPTRPDLPGIDDPSVHGVQTLADAADLLEHVERDEVRDVVVVGGGYIGLEMAEAFVMRNARVTVLEAGPQVLPALDRDMAALVTDALRRMGITVELGRGVTAFETGAVHTEDGPIPADLTVLGIGVAPNSRLAIDAGLRVGVKDAIVVDRRQRTSCDGVYAAGDCCESFHRVAERPVHIALGTVANKQGRVAGFNIGGSYATFPGVVGTAVTRVCETEAARTGLTEAEAARYGFDAVGATITSSTRAGYFPDAKEITVKLVGERRSGRVLGGQIVGLEGAAKRIDVIAVAVTARMTVEDMTALDLSYAPPFGPVWDPVLTAARSLSGALRAAT